MSHERLISYMSWVPLLGSGFGSVLGGILTDKLVRFAAGRSRSYESSVRSVGDLTPINERGLEMRALLAGISCILSAPFVILAIFGEFPDCFTYLVASGLVSISSITKYYLF